MKLIESRRSMLPKGDFKEENREGVREMRENSRETVELGRKMTEEADQINTALESINLQDQEDVQAISEAKRSYQGSFDRAFGERVESAGQEIGRQGEQIKGAVGAELRNVRAGSSKLERAGSISDIGRNAAETGRSKLEGSAREYEEIISEDDDIVDETKQQIQSLKSHLKGIWG